MARTLLWTVAAVGFAVSFGGDRMRGLGTLLMFVAFSRLLTGSNTRRYGGGLAVAVLLAALGLIVSTATP